MQKKYRTNPSRSLASVSSLSALSCGLCLAGAAWAEEDRQRPVKLGEGTVTATRTELDVDKAPASTTVLPQDAIAKKHAPTLDEAPQ